MKHGNTGKALATMARAAAHSEFQLQLLLLLRPCQHKDLFDMGQH